MDQNTVWVIAIAALIVGGLIGFLFGKGGPDGTREVKLAEELEKTQSELEQYRQDVNQHFSTTADLVNDLTQQYQRVHEHLAQSAGDLCRDEKLVESLQQSGPLALQSQTPESDSPEKEEEVAKESTEKPAESEAAENVVSTEQHEDTKKETASTDDETDVRAPLDYAPKRSEEEPGTLAADFGLKEKDSEQEESIDPSKVYEDGKSKSA